jgi:hypothetical protein
MRLMAGGSHMSWRRGLRHAMDRKMRCLHVEDLMDE